MSNESAEGVWFIYSWDMNAYPIGVFGDELEARRWADDLGYHVSIVYWPFGVEWTDVDN